MHVTLRVVEGLPTLRERVLASVVTGALADAPSGRVGTALRILHFSIQSNHLHLLVEADDGVALARGVGGLATRIAMRINRALERHGRVFADRFHARELRTPTEMRRALVYVLRNVSKHARPGAHAGARFDPLSSAASFAAWRELAVDAGASPLGWLAAPRTWLARIGWQRAAHASGPLSIREARA